MQEGLHVSSRMMASKRIGAGSSAFTRGGHATRSATTINPALMRIMSLWVAHMVKIEAP